MEHPTPNASCALPRPPRNQTSSGRVHCQKPAVEHLIKLCRRLLLSCIDSLFLMKQLRNAAVLLGCAVSAFGQTPSFTITNFAGNGTSGFSGDAGAANV